MNGFIMYVFEDMVLIRSLIPRKKETISDTPCAVVCSDNTRRPYNINNGINVNLLKPTGYVMHQQFNIQQLYVLPTLYLCVLYLSENKQRLAPLTP